MPSSSSTSSSPSRRVKIVLDDYCVHYCRKEYETANKQLCIENALKWVNA